jgi:cytochrome c peroxidase
MNKRTLLGCCLALLAIACDTDLGTNEPPGPLPLDVALRQEIGRWGVVPIGPMEAQDPALVELGRALMFDKILSGNRDISCATCHHPQTSAGDGLSLSIGTGGTGLGTARALGQGREFVPRSAPTLLNSGLGLSYVFWDARVNGWKGGPFQNPAGSALPGLPNILAAQAMFPVTNRREMRGDSGDRDAFGQANDLAQFGDTQYAAIWRAVMVRLLGIPEYVGLFAAAFPGVPAGQLGFEHAAIALAAFQMQALTRTRSPFDRYLGRESEALSGTEKRGALLFFQKARCGNCHNGPFLGGSQFANVASPQIGPGAGTAAPLDKGVGETFDQPFYDFAFRVPALRNVELTAPYMHAGAYPTLESVVRHYNNVDSAARHYDVSQVAPGLRDSYHGDQATIGAVLATLDQRLREPIRLSAEEQEDLVAFLKALTDPAARDLSELMPSRVPSGLPLN